MFHSKHRLQLRAKRAIGIIKYLKTNLKCKNDSRHLTVNAVNNKAFKSKEINQATNDIYLKYS